MDGSAALKGLTGLGLAVALAACAVDNRQLSSTGENAGSGSSAGMNSFGGGAAQDAAVATPLPVCEYGVEVEDGCETLVSNPGFARDAASWKAEDATVTMTWSATDAGNNDDSGSLSVLNSLYGAADGIASRAATQCLPTHSGQAYGFGLDVFIPEGQGEGLDGGDYHASAGLSVIFFTSKRCDEFTLASATSDLQEDAGKWAHLEGRAVAPQSAESMLVRLVTFKNFQEYNFEARFDNVLVRPE
ncbi:MAG TPA: hypothetical protein VER11_35325 [Polyangiaceae bacterium]|nr:hypothetical protein [Polyangiaceae bacterium]